MLKDAFKKLDIPMTATCEDIHNAYIKKVKESHYDNFLDIEDQEIAQKQMIAINNAYRIAMEYAGKLEKFNVSSNLNINYKEYAWKLYLNKQYEGALFQIDRDKSHDEEWYYIRGMILMGLENFLDAHECFRQAVKSDQNNSKYRKAAFDAAVAYKKSNLSLKGKIRTYMKKYLKF